MTLDDTVYRERTSDAKKGMRPAFACLKIVTCETAKILESSLAVRRILPETANQIFWG
jgi:hypothetical protein